MELKDRVITVLSSWAGSRTRVLVVISCSGWSAVQVTPRVRMFPLSFQQFGGAQSFGGASGSRNNDGGNVTGTRQHQVGEKQQL